MDLKAIAGKKLLTAKRDDDSPVLVLDGVTVVDGHE